MDILKVLAYNNDKTVRETVVSSFLNYFLDPQGDHGLGSSLLVELLTAMKSIVSQLSDDLIGSVTAYQKAPNTRISISSEWGGSEGSATMRRLDSLVTIRHNTECFLIGIEIKLYEGSVSDSGQLVAYAEMLAEYKNQMVEVENLDADLVRPILCYLVPTGSGKAMHFAKVAAKKCHDVGVQGVYLIEWSKSGSAAKDDSLLDVSMEEQIRNILTSQNDGSLSPADQHALHILKSLRNAALNGFRFEPPIVRSEARFPSNREYEEALIFDPDNQKDLLDRFRTAVKMEGINRPLIANSRHTTIGVPARMNPLKGQNNTLCRIVTVNSYEDGNVLDQFILQIDKAIFESSKEEVNAALEAFNGRAKLSDADCNRNQMFHPNGKANEPVFRISFTGPADSPENDVRAFQGLLQVLRKIFLK